MKKKRKLRAKPYPIKDGHRLHFVHYPIQKSRGVYVAVSVMLKPAGYCESPIAVKFKTEKECQKACDIHNSYHGWTKEEVRQIISESMKKGTKK